MGESVSSCGTNGLPVFNGAIMSQRLQFLPTGPSQSYNYSLALAPYFGVSFLNPLQDTGSVIQRVRPRGDYKEGGREGGTLPGDRLVPSCLLTPNTLVLKAQGKSETL